MSSTHPYLERFDVAEYGLCQRLNRLSARKWPCRVFQVASRLGDGIAWYTLAGALLLGYRGAAVPAIMAMALTGVTGVLVYKGLKSLLVRERPFIRHAGIQRAMPPLDRYSFPSGHTLHAVSFTWQIVAFCPELGWILVPFAATIAMSRVVLGLHYPTDVLAGGALGSALAIAGLAIAH